MKSYPTPVPPRALLENASTLIVRPDLLRSTLVADVETDDLGRGLAALEAASRALQEAIGAALPGSQVILRGLDLRHETSKVKSRSGAAEVRPSITGVIEVPLAAALDYWARARLVARLWATTEAAVAQGLRSKPRIRAAFGAPSAVVREPEAFRGELIERWLERIQEIARRAAASGVCAGLSLRACDVPGAVEQRPRSLEEVSLELAIAGPPLEASDARSGIGDAG
ncbi:MAG: hypothetical protein KC486_22580 [Myxococcales bacterium]|nr:hypothetical protein [Myxococcales bacterium]